MHNTKNANENTVPTCEANEFISKVAFEPIPSNTVLINEKKAIATTILILVWWTAYKHIIVMAISTINIIEMSVVSNGVSLPSVAVLLDVENDIVLLVNDELLDVFEILFHVRTVVNKQMITIKWTTKYQSKKQR